MARRYDLTSLELFVAVCDAKSISKAAEEQSIAASAISKRISQLENIAGASLITRTRSGVVPIRSRRWRARTWSMACATASRRSGSAARKSRPAASNGFRTQLIRYRILVSTLEAAIRLVGSGLVVSIVPVEIASRHAKVAGIRVIPLTDDWAHRQCSICCRARRALPKPAAAFVTHLLDCANA